MARIWVVESSSGVGSVQCQAFDSLLEAEKWARLNPQPEAGKRWWFRGVRMEEFSGLREVMEETGRGSPCV